VKRLGFIGTGNLTAFFVEGLTRIKADYDITVSPRNAAKAEELRRRFGVRIARDNQDIIDTCDLVVVAVLPQDANAVLGPLRYREDRTIMSAMAGVSLVTMQSLVRTATATISMMPGLANAHNVGPSALYPDEPASRELLAKLGPVHVYESEAAFTTASVMGGFSGMSVLMMRDAMAWFAANGLAPDDARRLVAEVLRGNATMLLESRLGMDEVARGVVTPGGITEQGRRLLDQGKSWGEALDSLRQRIAGNP